MKNTFSIRSIGDSVEIKTDGVCIERVVSVDVAMRVDDIVRANIEVLTDEVHLENVSGRLVTTYMGKRYELVEIKD